MKTSKGVDSLAKSETISIRPLFGVTSALVACLAHAAGVFSFGGVAMKDLGREEFDWERMRREEDEYFAAKKATPKHIRGVINLIKREAKLEGEALNRAKEIERLRAMPYQEYLASDWWPYISELARKRDGHRCRKCASKRSLNVHHLTYERLGDEKVFDLITLCRQCHKLLHINPTHNGLWAVPGQIDREFMHDR